MKQIKKKSKRRDKQPIFVLLTVLLQQKKYNLVCIQNILFILINLLCILNKYKTEIHTEY